MPEYPHAPGFMVGLDHLSGRIDLQREDIRTAYSRLLEGELDTGRPLTLTKDKLECAGLLGADELRLVCAAVRRDIQDLNSLPILASDSDRQPGPSF